MFTGTIGSDSSVDCPQIVTLADPQGSTITVSNLAASTGTISYYNNGLDQGPSGTITPGNSQGFTTAAFLTSSGVSTVQIVGPGY